MTIFYNSAQYKTTGGNGGGSPCVLPFIHQTATCSGCIKLNDNDPTYWCATSDMTNYYISAKYKTTGGNGGGSPCVLPFIHQTATCYGCIKLSDSDPSYWCSVTDNYDRDQKYGFCPRDAPRVESCTRE